MEAKTFDDNLVAGTLSKPATKKAKTGVRVGWEEDAKEIHRLGEDKLLIPAVFDDEDVDKYL